MATPWGCMNPARRPSGFAIRRKKGLTYETGGFVIPHNFPHQHPKLTSQQSLPAIPYPLHNLSQNYRDNPEDTSRTPPSQDSDEYNPASA